MSDTASDVQNDFAFISCLYEEFASEPLSTYRGFRLQPDNIVFFTGDPVKDYQDATEHASDRETGLSSSVDHFVSDCDGLYKWHIDNRGRRMIVHGDENGQ